MPLADITDPLAIDAAITEFDELGRDAFLAKYGFGRSTRFVVRANERDYDSKALLGAAHGNQFPELGPLLNTDFSGGRPTIRRLEHLGFTRVKLDGKKSRQAHRSVLSKKKSFCRQLHNSKPCLYKSALD